METGTARAAPIRAENRGRKRAHHNGVVLRLAKALASGGPGALQPRRWLIRATRLKPKQVDNGLRNLRDRGALVVRRRRGDEVQLYSLAQGWTLDRFQRA